MKSMAEDAHIATEENFYAYIIRFLFQFIFTQLLPQQPKLFKQPQLLRLLL